MACCGVLWRVVVWCGVVWRGVAWRGVAWRGVAWRGVVWRGVVWRGVVWCGVAVSNEEGSRYAYKPPSTYTYMHTHLKAAGDARVVAKPLHADVCVVREDAAKRSIIEQVFGVANHNAVVVQSGFCLPIEHFGRNEQGEVIALADVEGCGAGAHLGVEGRGTCGRRRE